MSVTARFGWWLLAALGGAPLLMELVCARHDLPDHLPVYGFPVGRSWWAGTSLEWFVSAPGLLIDLTAAALMLAPVCLLANLIFGSRPSRMIAITVCALGLLTLLVFEAAPVALGLHHPTLELPRVAGGTWRFMAPLEPQTYE